MANCAAKSPPFQTLLREMQTVVRNTCRSPKSASDAPTCEISTTQNEKQKRPTELIAQVNTSSTPFCHNFGFFSPASQ